MAAKKASASPPAAKATKTATRAPRKTAAKKATARKVATTGFVWACPCGKTSTSHVNADVTVSGRCPECGGTLTLQET